MASPATVAHNVKWQLAGESCGGEDDDTSSPRSCCSACFSCADGTTVVSDGAWEFLLDEDDDESDLEESDSQEVTTIQQHLENMNVASDDVNALQKELASQSEQRGDLVQLWASGSARLVRCVGKERLATVRGCHSLQRRCRSAREAVEAASAQYREAVEVGASEEELACLLKAHAQNLSEYQEAQVQLGQSQRRLTKLGKEALSAADEYIEAEAQYHDELAEIDASIDASRRRLTDAKMRYQNAMEGLESLSEEIHRRRAAA